MTVIEGRNQPDLAGEEHTSSEDIPTQVPDTDDGEGLGLDIVAQLPEVPLHTLPRTARRDPYLLVVITIRTTRGEGIVEPEIVLRGDGIRDIREARRALVSSVDQIRVRIIIGYYAVCLDDLAIDEIIEIGRASCR